MTVALLQNYIEHTHAHTHSNQQSKYNNQNNYTYRDTGSVFLRPNNISRKVKLTEWSANPKKSNVLSQYFQHNQCPPGVNETLQAMAIPHRNRMAKLFPRPPSEPDNDGKTFRDSRQATPVHAFLQLLSNRPHAITMSVRRSTPWNTDSPSERTEQTEETS